MVNHIVYNFQKLMNVQCTQTTWATLKGSHETNITLYKRKQTKAHQIQQQQQQQQRDVTQLHFI